MGKLNPVAWRGFNELGEVVTEWIDGVPPASMVDLCGKPASFARIQKAYTCADPAEIEQLTLERDRLQAGMDATRRQLELANADRLALANHLKELLEYAELGWDFTPDISVKVRSLLSSLEGPTHAEKLALAAEIVLGVERLPPHSCGLDSQSNCAACAATKDKTND